MKTTLAFVVGIIVIIAGSYLLYFLITYAMPRRAEGQPIPNSPKANVQCYYPTYSDDKLNPPLCCWNIKPLPPDVFLGCVR